MFSQTYYLILSKMDGKYLLAQPEPNTSNQGTGYLLIFQEHFDALSYLNTHASDVAERFAVESIAGSQLKTMLRRWNFHGLAIVQDPLLPTVEFLSVG